MLYRRKEKNNKMKRTFCSRYLYGNVMCFLSHLLLCGHSWKCLVYNYKKRWATGVQKVKADLKSSDSGRCGSSLGNVCLWSPPSAPLCVVRSFSPERGLQGSGLKEYEEEDGRGWNCTSSFKPQSETLAYGF